MQTFGSDYPKRQASVFKPYRVSKQASPANGRTIQGPRPTTASLSAATGAVPRPRAPHPMYIPPLTWSVSPVMYPA